MKAIPPFGLRMPTDVRARIEEAAVANNRSMNAEIIARLEATFTDDGQLDRIEATVLALARKAGVEVVEIADGP